MSRKGRSKMDRKEFLILAGGLVAGFTNGYGCGEPVPVPGTASIDWQPIEGDKSYEYEPIDEQWRDLPTTPQAMYECVPSPTMVGPYFILGPEVVVFPRPSKESPSGWEAVFVEHEHDPDNCQDPIISVLAKDWISRPTPIKHYIDKDGIEWGVPVIATWYGDFFRTAAERMTELNGIRSACGLPLYRWKMEVRQPDWVEGVVTNAD